MPINSKVKKLYDALKADGGDVGTPEEFNSWFFKPGKEGYKNRKSVYDTFKADGADVGKNYDEFGKWLGIHAVYPTVNKYHQQMLNSVDPNKSRASELTRKAVGQAVRATNNVRKPVVAKVVNRKGKPTGEKFAITPAKTVEDLDREYAQETTKNWENELHDQMADADKDAAKISDMFKSFLGSTDEVGSVWGNLTRGGGIAGTPHSVTTNNGILENTEARQLLAAGEYNRKRRELLQLEKDSRNGAIFDDHSFWRGMYDAAKDTGFLTGGASDLINSGSLLATKQDLDKGIHTEAGDMLLQQAVKNSDAQSHYGDNQGWMYTGGVITTNMAPFITQIASAGFSEGMSKAIGKVVQGAASKVALGTMEKATGMAGAHIANYIGKVTGLTTKAFGKVIQYGIVGAAQANTVGLGNVANDVVNRYTGQVYQDEQGNYKFGTFDSDGKLVHEGGEDFLTALVKGDAAQTIEFATELAGGGIDAVGTALKNFVTKGGKKIINKYNMENVSKVIDFLLNNKVSKHARYLKAGADRTLGKVELNSIVGESLEEELGIIANTVFTGDNKISDLWDEKQQSQIWGGMLLSIGLMKGVVAPFHAYNAKQYYSYKHKLDKADVNLSQLLGKEKWEELRNQIDATTNEDMPEMVNKINRDVALGKNRQPVREYIQNLLIMRGYDIGNMLAAKKAVEDKGKGVSVKNMEKNQAYQQGRDAYGYDTHEIQLDQADKQKTLAQLLGITEQQLSTMSDEELDNLSGRDDNLDKAIYDYQLSTIRYQGVVDNAQDQVDLAAQKAAQAVDMYTDKSRNTIRNATIKATGGLEDYGVYIINGNIATHDDGSIDVGNSDDMILFYDPSTNTVEHADATRFAELGSEENADEVRNQAVADAKENAIKEITGIIDGVVEVGTQFKTVDADGTEHTYEVLADNGDGTAMVTIDGNIPTEIVKGENVQVPVSFEELQKMKDASDQQRLQAAKAQREQMEKERAEQQNQAQTTQAENPARESNTQSAPIEDNLDYSDIIREDGKVQMVDVSDKDGNNLFPDAKDVFYIQGNKMRTKFAYIDANGELKTQGFPTGLVKIKTRGEVSVDDYKKYRNMILAAESPAMPESSMIEGNSGVEVGDNEEGKLLNRNNDGAQTEQNQPSTSVTTSQEDAAGSSESKDTNISANGNENNESLTFEDGTPIPVDENGETDLSQTDAAHAAEWYDNNLGEDADDWLDGEIKKAKKVLEQAQNKKVTGTKPSELVASKKEKEAAIADAQAHYDSAISIRDALKERQLAKVEDTAEGRKNLIEKARRKFARLKSAVKDDAEAVSQLYKDVVGSLLHRLYDGTGIDVTDTIPLTAEEYVASNLGAHSLNYEGTETSKGVKQETGLSREDFAKTQLLAADGKGTTIDDLVHSLWENRPSNLESLNTQDIRNALIDVLTSGFKASEARNYVENLRIAQAENFLEEQKKAADNAAFAEEQTTPAEQQTETAPESEEKTEEEKTEEKPEEKAADNEKINEQTNENINTPEVPEDATDENPLGLQLSEDKVPFEIEGGKSGETYDITDNEDRQRLINDNKVDDKDILNIDMPKHVHKAIKELCKKMGLKVQFLYMGARSNGWVENGTMYLALDTEKATQFVFGHEMTHAIKQKNPEAYKELVKVAMAVTTKKKFEEDLAKVYQNYHGISGYNNVDDYVEEVVADNLGKFINNFDLAQKFSLRLNHPVLATILHAIQKIRSLLYGDFYKSVDALERIVEKAYVDTAKGEVTNTETGEDVYYSLRQKPEPKKKGIGYKVFVLKDGKLYPPMVANPDGAATPVGVWLDADAAPIAGESKTGRPQVKQGGKGTQGGSGKLAYRPGWHLGVVPYAIQFNRKDAEGNKTLFPKNFVFAEVEYAADVDYQEEARQEGINPSGKYQHSLAGLKHLPTDGYYMYRTNPNPETDPWVITGAMKVNRILTRAEQAELVKNAGREPQQIQEGDIVTDDVVNSINQEIAAAPKFSLKVYHGSGADFTEFDFDHMGEGEGTQSFGWGGYVTSSPEIGKYYAESGRKDKYFVYNGEKLDWRHMSATLSGIVGMDGVSKADNFLVNVDRMGVEKAKQKLKDSIDEYQKLYKENQGDFYKKQIDVMKKLLDLNLSVETPKTSLYEVDIPDDNGSNYLDWDAPITDELIDKVAKALPSLRSFDIKDLKKDRTFGNLYKTISMRSVTDDATFNDDKAASKLLSSLGYTGIKYKAGRNFGGAEVGDTNYVIFKPEDMRITEHTKFSLRLKSAIEDTETNPSDAQKESGNYKKGHIKFGGYDYTIENPKGSTRSGKDADGKEWKVTMHDTYGYIRGKFGKDGDHLDMFINDKADLDNWNGDVFVVDQVNPDGSFDEHKVMYGYDSMSDAEKAYLANYSKGWQGLGNITGASKAEFDKWLDTSNHKLKPFADYAKVKFSQAQSVAEPRFSLDDIKPVGVGAFGNIYNQFRGKAKAAIEFLKKVRGGEAVGALHHKDIGDIDLVWGKEGTGHSDGYGLSKLVKYHPEVLDNLQEILNDMRVVSSSKNRVNLESETHKAGVRLTWDGERKSWLLTAFKKETSASDKRTDTAATSLEGDTALSQTEGSAAKIDNSSETAKENGEKFSLKDEKIKSVAEKFGVNEDDVAMYANAVERGSTAEAARARANIKRYLLQANEDKISSFKDIIKYTKPINEALKENFGDLDAMIEERRKQVEAERNAMEAARKRAQEEEEKRQKHLDELSLIPTDELDKRYMDAIANKDEATAREMLDESARRKGYDDADSDYQGQGAWAAPSNPQYESDKERRADIDNAPDVNLEDIALGYSLQPDDYFSHPERYSQNTPHGLESVKAINTAIDAIKNGEKDVKVKVYRAVPTSVKEGKLRNGDWVTPSKKYAEMHGDHRLEGKYRIIEDEVPANQLWWDGNDANEFGFDDGKEYRYKNAKNNRKLNDLITYDNKGNVIPPSKRFNSRKSDIRFSLAGERGAAAADKAEERTFRMDNLSVARKMEEEKKDAKAIKIATGWERGADGKWRYEMPDAKIKDTMDVGGGHIVKRYEDDMLWNGGKLSDVIDAPELFKAYPHLKDVRIETDAIMNDMPSNGEYNAKTNTITIHADELKYMNSILNHEIQHVIQSIEGFDRGGSPRLVRGEIKKRLAEVTKQIRQLRAEGKEDEAKAIVEKNRGLYNAYQANDDYNSYKSLAGEVEARNVQERMNMTPEERRKTLAESTEDVARKDQIFLGVGDVSFSLRDMADGKESGAADMAEDLKSLNTPGEVDDAIKTAIDDMPSGWKMANKKMIHVAQALGENRKAEIAGEEPKFSLKDGTLIKAGTYFSGGGLVEEGLKGIIDTVVAVEYDEKISGVYRNNFGQHIVTADVRDVDPKELVKQIDGEVEYFHASPVCKNYSQAKSNHAEVELDKETAASTAEFINAIKPKVVTIENVKGYKDSEAMKTITDALDANGYTWDADVYNAADYGGYTNRERLIVRAVRDGKLPDKPKKMAHKSGWYEAVADIIPTLTEKKNGVAPWMDIRLKADGIDWRNIDKPLYVMGSAYADGKIPHAFADELLPTLRTKSGDVIVMPDGKVYRAMGRVLARVSGVSDDYKMPFSENLSHTIIGNGIPTQLTEHVIAPLLQNTLRQTTPEDGNTKFSLRGSTPYDKQMEEWMEKNHLEKGAVPMEKPIMKEGENIFDYANRMVEWTRNQNLWKTAPKKTGFQDALDKWKADNGLSPDAYPPVRPHRENYSTEIGYAEDLEEYNKKKELWKSAPKPKDFDLSVDLEDMNKQLRNIRRAVLNQKNYDQRTVKAVSDLVRKMLNIGWGDGLSRGKVGNLLSAAKNATGANDVKKYLDKAMGILAENYLNRLSTAYDNLINTKGARADQSGVIKMGSLDAKGQAFISEYKKAINMDDSSLNTYIANIEEDSAKNEDNVEMNDYRLAGIQAAIMYKQQIGGNDADISELKRQIGELKNKKDATKEDKDLLKSLEKKLFENKFDRITMYENLLNNIQRMVKESKGRAKEFREEITEHKNEILHRANLDLEGVDSTYYDTTTAKKKFVNNDLQRAVFSSTYTFEQFLKFFGKHSANGEGRLYNYFHKLNQDALDEEQLYNEMNRNALDEKTKELFGKNKFMNLVGIDGKGMKEMDVEVTDYSNKETGKRTIHLKQGQMLYIYLVNKETDGEMKLRAMGITEEDVAAIEENLDPRVKAMGEWLQDEYLPECQRRYQATHTKYFGAPMKEVENYFPLAINNRARNVKEDVNQDSDAMSQLAGTSTGAIVTRRVNVIPLDIENADAFEVAFNHLQEMEEWSAMLPFRQDINTLLSYTHFRNQVQNMSSVAYGSGKTLWDEFKQTAQIAAGTYKPKVNAGMMDSRIAAAMGGIAVAKISGRLWTAIKQSQSATVFLPECDFTRFVKNGVNPYGSWKWAMENIPDFRKRVENMTYGDVKLRQYLDELEKWHDWTKTISKIGMAPNILVDGITCAVGARSVYETEVNRLTKLGYPKEKAEEKAYYKAVAAYNKTQQSSGGMYLSPMQVDRTYVSAALSLFKNANFAYGRMQIEACRGLARTYDFWGGKHKTTLIESMTRQIMEEDGLDENTARAIAKATYNRTFRQSIGRLINFATLVPVSWALYKVLPYLLTGDDDDKKNDMIEEAVLKGFATSLSDNYVIPFASNILNAGLKVEDGKPTFDPEVFRYQNLYINPATSDLANIYSMIGNQKWYSVANKLGMLGVQSLIGFNPETVGALYQAFAEADYDNGNVAKEWQIGILKAISAPEESIRELYMDELGLKSGDIKKIPLAELEKRYAERQINRDNLLSQIGMDAETFNGYVEKYQKSFEKKIKDKMDKWDEYDKKKADEFFDTTSDPKLKDMIAKKRANDANAAADEQIAKEGLNQEKKGKEPSEEAYDAVKMFIDVAEDNAISTYNKVLNKRYASLNDEYNNQTDAMKYIFMSKHPNFKAYKDLKSEYTTYGKKMKELKEKLVSADGYDAKQTILKQIRAERDKFYELQSKVR